MKLLAYGNKCRDSLVNSRQQHGVGKKFQSGEALWILSGREIDSLHRGTNSRGSDARILDYFPFRNGCKFPQTGICKLQWKERRGYSRCTGTLMSHKTNLKDRQKYSHAASFLYLLETPTIVRCCGAFPWPVHDAGGRRETRFSLLFLKRYLHTANNLMLIDVKWP